MYFYYFVRLLGYAYISLPQFDYYRIQMKIYIDHNPYNSFILKLSTVRIKQQGNYEHMNTWQSFG